MFRKGDPALSHVRNFGIEAPRCDAMPATLAITFRVEAGGDRYA